MDRENFETFDVEIETSGHDSDEYDVYSGRNRDRQIDRRQAKAKVRRNIEE